ncbi:MAG TPA: TonB-dependent receptor plug domain-containing protein [Allosphingosinicella sp.]|nr:TonB-dependent receptor plug domain-containing protein [Allosphingosinicella sp.]
MPKMIAKSGERRLFWLASVAVVFVAAPAGAQETGNAPPPVAAAPANVERAKTYTPQDFARFAPKNALDMLRQVPGFIIQQQESGRRGFGESGGNILLNGKRISGKSNDALSELGRIAARNVIRIEIRDGATLNIPGLSGQVANIIAKSGSRTGQFAWRPEFRARNTNPLLLRGDASVSGSTGPFDYNVGIRNDAFRGGGAGPTLIFSPGGDILDRREERVIARGDRPKLSGSLKYDGPGSSVGNLNLSYGRNFFRLDDDSDRSGPGQVDRFREVRSREDEYSYEAGADYEFELGGGRLKLIGLHQFEHSPFQTRSITSFADDSPRVGTRFVRTADEKETIGRAEYRWKAGRADWQVSAEGAFNSLDNVAGLFTLLPNGEFREVQLPGGSAKVTEDRGEARLTYGRPLSPKLSLQGSVGGEYSKLSLLGADASERTFWRPKGFISTAWKPSRRLDMNAKLERKVGQLNFLDFLASENLSNENRNAGNPDLVPPQSWELDLSGTRNLGPFGSTTLRLFGRLLEDVVDQIPIGLTGESPGNIDKASIYGMESRSTFLLEPLGWRGAKIDARFQLQTSRVRDPLTGEPRQISGNLLRAGELSLRHDIPASDWAWGGAVQHMRPAKNFRLGEVSLGYEGPVFANLFVENKDVFGLTVRGTLGNLLGGDQILDRTVSAGRRTNPVLFLEQRRRTIGPIFGLSVSGSL